MSPEKSLLLIPCFHHGFECLEDVLKVMMPHLSVDGKYLIRLSLSKQNCITISVTDNSTVKHLNVQFDDNFVYFNGKVFKSMEELCNFYSKYDVPNAEGYTNIRLLHPIYNEARRKSETQISDKISDSPLFENSFPSRLDDNRDLRHSKSCVNLKVNTKSLTSRKCSVPFLFQQDQDGVESCDNLSSGLNSKSLTKLKLKTSSKHQKSLASNLSEPGQDHENHVFQTTDDRSPYYSSVRRKDESVLESVLEQIRKMEAIETCVCGLPVSESKLSDGWSVHVSTDPGSKGRVFFDSPDGDTTWKLPEDVKRRLSPSQKDFIKLIRQKKKIGI